MKYKLYDSYKEFCEKNNLTPKEANEFLEKEIDRREKEHA